MRDVFRRADHPTKRDLAILACAVWLLTICELLILGGWQRLGFGKAAEMRTCLLAVPVVVFQASFSLQIIFLRGGRWWWEKAMVCAAFAHSLAPLALVAYFYWLSHML